MDGKHRVVVDRMTDRQVASLVEMPNTCVAIAPFILAGRGMVTCLLCFKYDSTTKTMKTEMERERRHIKRRLAQV